MPLISKKILINSAYLETKSAIIFELKLLKSSIYFLVKMFIYALFYLDLLTSQYIPLSACQCVKINPDLNVDQSEISGLKFELILLTGTAKKV